MRKIMDTQLIKERLWHMTYFTFSDSKKKLFDSKWCGRLINEAAPKPGAPAV